MASANRVVKAPDKEYYEVRAVPDKGVGCFALKPLQPGTRILAEDPLLVVPMPDYLQVDIQEEFDKLSLDQKELYWTLHSGHGQPPRMWPSQIHSSVTGRERQRIQEQHDARTAKEPSLISIFQTNCMEMGKGAAIFPHAARFNHSCNPNACFTWNRAIGKETIHIINDVKEGEQITLSYCDMTHDKRLRSWELKHYGFVCDCPACAEDEDDEETFAYKSAQRRFRLQELGREVRFLRGPNLREGAEQADFVSKLLQLAALHIEEGDNTIRLASLYLDIALVCELKGDFRMGAQVAAKACAIKKLSQGPDFTDYNAYQAVAERLTVMALREV